MTDSAWVQIGMLVALLVTTVAKVWTDERRRKWDVEDRKNEALALAQKTELEARKLQAQLTQHNQVVTTQHEELKVKLEDNTQITAMARGEASQAYTEANTAIRVANGMNEKLLQVQQMILSVQPLTPQRRAEDV